MRVTIPKVFPRGSKASQGSFVEPVGTYEEKPHSSFVDFARDDVEEADDIEEDPVMNPPSFKWVSVRQYLITRWTHLLPSPQYIKANKALINPFPPLKEVPRKQWLFILMAFMAWTWDAFDFFTVALNVQDLSEEFHQSTYSITYGITLVLMLRSVGAVIFGVLGDRYGTKWPFVVNLILMMAIQLAVSFVHSFPAFLGVRSLFGIIMGGIYGSATSTALNDCPHRPRGFISGLVQQGYAFGYLLAVIFTRALANTQRHKWRAVYWLAAGVSFLLACFRAALPETEEFQQKLQARKEAKMAGIETPSFLQKVGEALKTYWLISIYLVLLMAGFNFMSHGSQDLYPTFLDEQLGFSKDRSTVTMCVANLGALTGGLIVGHLSSFIGRRLSIMICCIGGGALIYPSTFVRNTGINAGVFFLQFFVQGAFGVVPAHLTELSHPEFKTVVVGLAYQLGNLAASASSTIETQGTSHFPITMPNGKKTKDYGKVMAIFMGAVFAYVLFVTFAGPENSRAVRAIAIDNDQRKPERGGGEIIDEESLRKETTRKGSTEVVEYA